MSFRTERDPLGEVEVPTDAYYGAQTQRAVENYPISGLREHPVFIRVFVELKKAGAQSGWLDQMQTREELYRLLEYDPAAEDWNGIHD